MPAKLHDPLFGFADTRLYDKILAEQLFEPLQILCSCNDEIVEFTDLAKQGLQTSQPLWMQKDRLPDWAQTRKEKWLEFAHSDDKLTGDNERRRIRMIKALEPSVAPKKKKESSAT